MFRHANRHASVAVFLVLALAAPLAASQEDVNLTSEYVSPFGDYIELQLRDTFTVGQTGVATATADLYGDTVITKGRMDVEGLFNVDAGTFRNYVNSSGSNHWFGINAGSSLPRVEFEVNGDVIAGMFRASSNKRSAAIDSSADQDTLLYFGPSLDGTKLYMGAYSGPDLSGAPSLGPGGWADPRSAARFYGSPMIVLNGQDATDNTPAGYKLQYSDGNVGIGTTTPNYKLQVGEPTGGTNSVAFGVGYNWYTFTCSRQFKTDIYRLPSAEVNAVGSKLDKMDVFRFHYLGDKAGDPLRTGIIAEEAPEELLSPDKTGLSLTDSIAFMIAAVRKLSEENRVLEKQIAVLEQQAAAGKRKP